MKFKLDENIGSIGKRILEADGHDVMTVSDQRLNGATDERLFAICREERRILITLDHDFGHVMRFPPETTAGVVALESPGRLSPRVITARIAELAQLIRVRPIDRELWIVEPDRVPHPRATVTKMSARNGGVLSSPTARQRSPRLSRAFYFRSSRILTTRAADFCDSLTMRNIFRAGPNKEVF